MKKTLIKLSLALGAIAATFGVGSTANAADFSFQRNFSQDDDVQLFNFSVGTSSNVTLRTYSYAGGTQADGTVVAAGGFDPVLALFDAAGNFINLNDDGGFSVPADPVTGASFDSFLQALLAPGNYTASVMQFNNFPVGPTLADGFIRDGDGNFTAPFCLSGATAFCDVTGTARTNAWAFDVLNVSSAVVVPPTSKDVPEPALLSGLVMLGVAGLKSRKNKMTEAA